MIITTEISSFDEFKAWSGGKDTLDDLSYKQQKRLFQYAEEVFPEGCSDGDLNNWLWFERDEIYAYLKIDENGNDIGSRAWASLILMEYAEKRQSVNQFGNIYNIITCFLDEEYDEGICDNEHELKYAFDRYVFSKWKEYMTQQLMAWHSEFGKELIEEWIDENYDEDEIPDNDDVSEEFDRYIESLNDLGED